MRVRVALCLAGLFATPTIAQQLPPQCLPLEITASLEVVEEHCPDLRLTEAGRKNIAWAQKKWPDVGCMSAARFYVAAKIRDEGKRAWCSAIKARFADVKWAE